MNATIPASMTIAEFDALPEREDGIKCELHEGELVEVTFPNTIHIDLQDRMKELLKPLANKGRVFTELPFQISTKSRPTKRCADVGCVDQDRWREALGTPVLEGAPELVVEVLSPSNSASELKRFIRLCLANGSHQFWEVDPWDKTIAVYSQDNLRGIEYSVESEPIPFGSGSIALKDVFEGIVE